MEGAYRGLGNTRGLESGVCAIKIYHDFPKMGSAAQLGAAHDSRFTSQLKNCFINTLYVFLRLGKMLNFNLTRALVYK